MRKRDFRGRCEKRTLPKYEGICKTFSDIQARYAEILSEREDIESFRTNVPKGLRVLSYIGLSRPQHLFCVCD